MSWRVFHHWSLLGRCYWGFVPPVLEYCSAVSCSAADTYLKLLDRVVSAARFLTACGCIWVWHCSATLCGSTVYVVKDQVKTRCIDFMVVYLCRMCQCGLQAVLWSHIGILIRFLVAEPSSTKVPLFLFQSPCGTILLTLYSILWDNRVSRVGQMLFYWPKLFHNFLSSTIFPFSSFHQSVGIVRLGSLDW